MAVRAVDDPDPNVRAEAAVALGESEDERAIDPLIRALADNTDLGYTGGFPSVRLERSMLSVTDAAAAGLVQLATHHHDVVASRLLEALTHPRIELRTLALKVLVSIQANGMAEHLGRMIREESLPDVQAHAVAPGPRGSWRARAAPGSSPVTACTYCFV
jgi:HEAT repeat protein